MKRDSLPKNLRATLDRRKIPTEKELNAMLKHLTPAQRRMFDHRI